MGNFRHFETNTILGVTLLIFNFASTWAREWMNGCRIFMQSLCMPALFWIDLYLFNDCPRSVLLLKTNQLIICCIWILWSPNHVPIQMLQALCPPYPQRYQHLSWQYATVHEDAIYNCSNAFTHFKKLCALLKLKLKCFLTKHYFFSVVFVSCPYPHLLKERNLEN